MTTVIVFAFLTLLALALMVVFIVLARAERRIALLYSTHAITVHRIDRLDDRLRELERWRIGGDG